VSAPVIELRSVTREHGTPPVVACADVSLAIAEGELAAIVGPSGSGKTTILQIMGTLDRPTRGHVLIDGFDVGRMSDDEVSGIRAHTIGFVFQQFHLADGVTALDNVAEALVYHGVPRDERRRRAADALERVSLGHRTAHKPHELSGGERQRVAIARALVTDPRVILADEPTGNLDTRAGEIVVNVLEELNRAGTALVVITHNVELAETFPRRITMRDGRVVGDDSRVAAGAIGGAR
jgi:putative ABC transport system ATP-binding protein